MFVYWKAEEEEAGSGDKVCRVSCAGGGEVLRAARVRGAVPLHGAAGLDARVGRAGRGAGRAGGAHARRPGARRARAVAAALGAAHPARRAAHRARRPARRAARQAQDTLLRESPLPLRR